MKPEEMYQHLRELAEKLNITVSEQNLRKSGVNVQSGFCIVKNRKLFILDKARSTFDKSTIIASYLNKAIDEDMYIMPAVREFIQKHADDYQE
jgi:flagellar hook-associated protein FlgK